jgi:hypothetical protein
METPCPRSPVRRRWNPNSDPGKVKLRDHIGGSSGDCSPIKFGSFSLGDVFEREINKFGRFAFRGKKSTGEASKRFVDEFVKLNLGIHGRESGGRDRGTSPENFNSGEGLSEKGETKPGRKAHHSPVTHLELV